MRPRSPVPFSPGGAAWGALTLLAGLNLLNYVDRYIMSAVLTPLKNDLRMSDGGVGWSASAFMLGYFLSAPLFGYLGDRYPRKFLMLAGVVVWSVATACSGLAQDFAQFFGIRIFVGVGEACFVTLGPAWISDLFAATRRNTALSLFYVAVPVGSAIGFTIGGWFAGHGDWRHAFIYTGLPGVIFALSLLFLREPRRGEADGLAVETARAFGAHWKEVFGLLLNRRYNLLVWGYAAQVFAVGAFGFWGPTFLYRVHHFPLATASSLFGEMLAGAGFVATLVGGFLGNRLRRRAANGYAKVMAYSLLATLPVCLFALTVSDGLLSLVGLGASMFFLFLPTGPITSEIFEIVPVHLRANAVALCTFMIHLFGDMGSPAIVGKLSDITHSLQKGVLLLPFVLSLGVVLWLLLVRFTREPIEVAP